MRKMATRPRTNPRAAGTFWVRIIQTITKRTAVLMTDERDPESRKLRGIIRPVVAQNQGLRAAVASSANQTRTAVVPVMMSTLKCPSPPTA
jgi:hypothetical protein